MIEQEKSFKDRIRESTNMTKIIPISFPLSVAERLSSYAKDNSNDCYWLAIRQLLDKCEESSERSNDVKMLIDRDNVNYERLSGRLDGVESDLQKFLDDMSKVEVKKRSTFGGGKENE